MSDEDIIEKVIGRFGKYQVLIYFLITLGRFPTDFQLSNVVFIVPNVEYVCKDEEAYNVTNHCPCNNPVYDESVIVDSVTTTWDLICNRSSLASLAQSFLQIGILAGSLIFGYISDRYGRRIACFLSLISQVIFVALSAASSELWMFMAFRFLIGTATGGTMLCCYVLLIELSGKSFRAYLTGMIEVSFILAYFTLPIIAYFIREWRYLQLVTSLPWIFVICYYFLIPESPRWLITVGKKKEAVEILKYIAKKNNRPIENIEVIVDEAHNDATTNLQQYGTFLDLFKTPNIRFYTIIVVFMWFCCAHTFFGVNQYIGALGGNIYLNVMLSAVGLMPSIFLVILASLYLRRKIAVTLSFTLAGLSLLCIIFVPSTTEFAILSFAIIGQTGAYVAFVLVYLHTSEMFPTVVRNSALGFGSIFARFGGFIAPFVVNIGIDYVTLITFSVLALSAGVACCFLPETKDIVLYNTIEQIEGTKKVNVEVT